MAISNTEASRAKEETQLRKGSMNIYEQYVLPPILNCLCGLRFLEAHRREIVSEARGLVLEIGIGSSLNEAFYLPERISQVIGIDPNETLLNIASNRSHESKKINLVRGLSETLPFRTNQFDSIVVTFCFCSIPNPNLALLEIKRVLKSGGEVHFCEHGLAPDARIQQWQRKIEPAWRILAGGCHLTRNIFDLFQGNEFELTNSTTLYARNVPKIAGFIYKGTAKLRKNS